LKTKLLHLNPRHWFNDEAVKRIYRNASVLLSGKAVAGLLSLVYVSLAAHALGAANFGVLVLVNVYTLSMAAILTVQGRNALVRYAALCLAENSREDLSKLLSFILLVELGFGSLAIVVTAILAPYAAGKFSWPAEALPVIVWYSLACVSMMHSMPAGVLYVFRRIKLLSVQQAMGPLVRLLGALIAYALDAGLVGFLWAWLVGTLAEAGTQWFFGLRELSRQGLLAGLLKWPEEVTRQHQGIWRFILANKMDISLDVLGSRAPALAVGWVLGPAATGLYQVALRIGMILAQPVLLIGQPLYPELSQLVAEKKFGQVSRVVLRTALIATMIGLAVLLILGLFGGNILALIGGADFAAAYWVLILIAVARTIHLFGFPLASAIVACGKPATVLKVNLFSTLLLLPVLLTLLYAFELPGVGVHAVLFAVVTVTWMAVVYRRHIASQQLPE